MPGNTNLYELKIKRKILLVSDSYIFYQSVWFLQYLSISVFSVCSFKTSTQLKSVLKVKISFLKITQNVRAGS